MPNVHQYNDDDVIPQLRPSFIRYVTDDEYFRARDSQSSGQGELNERALRLEALVDGILAQVADQKAVNAT